MMQSSFLEAGGEYRFDAKNYKGLIEGRRKLQIRESVEEMKLFIVKSNASWSKIAPALVRKHPNAKESPSVSLQ